jgi:hypothetical protein
MALLRHCLFTVRQRFGDLPDDGASSNDSAWHLGDVAEPRSTQTLPSSAQPAAADTQNESNKLRRRLE